MSADATPRAGAREAIIADAWTAAQESLQATAEGDDVPESEYELAEHVVRLCEMLRAEPAPAAPAPDLDALAWPPRRTYTLHADVAMDREEPAPPACSAWDARIEDFAAAVHQAYLDTCARLGWPVKPENRVPYEALSEDSKELDRASVRAVLALADLPALVADAARWRKIRPALSVDGDETDEVLVQWINANDELLADWAQPGWAHTVESIIDAAPTPDAPRRDDA